MIPNQPSSQRTNIHITNTKNSPVDTPSRKIKLTGVHSLTKSPSARVLSPKNYPIPAPYDKLLFHTGLYSENESRGSSLAYESVVEAVQGLSIAEGIQGVKDLQRSGVFDGKKRCLVLTSTNDRAMRLVEAVSKKKSKTIDLLLLGQLRPSGQYLTPCVVLVTSDPKEAVAFLKGNGFGGASLDHFNRRSSMEVQSMSSSAFKATMLNLMRESEDSVNTVVARSSHPHKQRPIHHWMVDKTSTGSFSTSEISAEKGGLQKRRSEEREQSQVREYDEKELRRDAVKNHQPVNKQSILQKNATQSQQKKTVASSDNYQINPRVYRHFPSNIITQVSDEYKGSVRQSIMNIEPDLSFKSTRQHFPSNLAVQSVEPQQETSRKNISGLGNTGEYRRVESYVNGTQGAPYSGTYRYQSSYIPQHVTKTYENSTNTQDYQTNNNVVSSPASPTRVVIRKQVTSPEQIYNTANIINNAISTSIPSPLKQQSSARLVSQQYVPSTYRAINSNKVSEVISTPTLTRQTYSSPIEQLRNIPNNTSSNQQNFVSPPKVTVVSSSGINWDDYEKVESDGRTIYRKKVALSPTVIPSVQVLKQSIQVKTVQNQSKPQQIQKKSEQIPQVTKSEENVQKNSKMVTSPKKAQTETVQNASSPNVLMLQSTLKPSPPPPIPTLKVSAPTPKQQTVKMTHLPPTRPVAKVDQKSRQASRGSKKAMLNESMFSRMSQLHSDGSILRRNNIRFGVRPPQQQKQQREVRYQPSMLQSKLSGIYKGADLTRKDTLNRVIAGEEQLQRQRTRLGHVVTRFNCFHFIVQEELSYLANSIQAHVATANDRIQTFTGMEQLYERIRSDRIDGKFDAGFIFARKQEVQLVNPTLLPQDYYSVTIERGEGEAMLEVEQGGRRMRMDQLGRLLLAQRMVIDSKLYQYVAYRSHKREIAMLADRFLHTEFILQQVETQFTSQIIDFYYCELARLTRLYLLCDKQQLGDLVRLVGVYAELNPHFQQQSCKIICLITDILTNQTLIMAHPTVTFISNPEDIRSHEDVLRYAHHAEEDQRMALPADRLFFHRALNSLEGQLQQRFPGRFTAISFSKLSEVYARLERLGKGRGGAQRNYLVVHESLSQERVSVQRFARCFMVGKAKAVQPQVARVLNFQELLEVLGK